MISVQVLCGISAIGLRSPENADLTTIAARSFNTLAKWLKRNPQLMDPDVVSSTQDSVTTLSQILAHQPVSEAVENEGTSYYWLFFVKWFIFPSIEPKCGAIFVLIFTQPTFDF